MKEARDSAGNVPAQYFSRGQTLSGTKYLYSLDHLGSTRELTDSGENVQSQYGYDPYGRGTKMQGRLASDFQYAAYYNHSASGLCLALYRNYSSDLRRWINRDPEPRLAEEILYAYVKNDTMGFSDPSGLQRTRPEPSPVPDPPDPSPAVGPLKWIKCHNICKQIADAAYRTCMMDEEDPFNFLKCLGIAHGCYWGCMTICLNTDDTLPELCCCEKNRSDEDFSSVGIACTEWRLFMGFEGFSPDAIKALVLAANEASRLRHVDIGTDHLLLGLLIIEQSVAAKTLASAGLKMQAIRSNLSRESQSSASPTHSPELTNIIDKAAEEARNLNSPLMCPEHLLLAICYDSSCRGNNVLVANGFRTHEISSALMKALRNTV